MLKGLKVSKEHKVPTKGLKEQQDSKVLKEPQGRLVQHKVLKVLQVRKELKDRQGLKVL